ncbi:MAG: methyltransferase, TIGR04325 family [Opitutaceae bacterium]
MVPPALAALYRRRGNHRWFRGPYQNWAEAERASSSYADPRILEKVLRATLAVREGKAAYEQDSVLFSEPACEFPLLAALLHVAARNEGRLRVLDFGGSLGSTYWRHRAWLPAGPLLRWTVVEQGHFAEAGSRHLESDTLRFQSSFEEAVVAADADVFVASTSLQYLRSPREFIAGVLRQRFPYLLFHNLPLRDDLTDCIMVQDVPPEIYPASYPVWFFNRLSFLELFADGYDLFASYPSTAVWNVNGREMPSTGLVFKRKQSPAVPPS